LEIARYGLSYLRPPGFEAHGGSNWQGDEDHGEARTLGLLDQVMGEDMLPAMDEDDDLDAAIDASMEEFPVGTAMLSEDDEYEDDLEEEVIRL
jgi:hypothetical protein